MRDNANELRNVAAHYRDLVQWISDTQARTGLEQLAQEYDARAYELESGSRTLAARWGGQHP